MAKHWTVDTIAEAIGKHETAGERQIAVAQIFDGGDVMMLTLGELEGLPVFLAATDDEIQMTCQIAPVDSVPNRAEFNERILRMGRILPLSSFSIGGDPKSGEFYELVNEMPSDTPIDSIVAEMVVLGQNAIEAAETVDSWKSSNAVAA